ncbi:hypothetical protein AGRA3207_002762 [Actinomadura graeca]|uniref:DUF222 domain-containing protein n=1 Tax=Actinomadura graeca TaxID=2750812 RepID=A0ABX8QUH1_9ACTN|nr:hypothetical protein [Actinomadura graeca]QXJ21859.1 hypothetical protein AGRA3207_002762 [Actinomadura graeca]
MEPADDRTLLGIYLNDHLAGAAAGVELARRVAATHDDPGGRLRGLADDIAADRGALLSITMSLGIPVRRYKSMAMWAMEKAGRLKFNGRLRSRSPLSDLLELEAMRVAVEGKAACWRTLLTLADDEPDLDAAELRVLEGRAQAQILLLEELRVEAAGKAFRGTGAADDTGPAA